MLTAAMLMSTLAGPGWTHDERGWGGPGPWWPIFPILWLVLLAVAVTTALLIALRRGRQAGVRAGEQRLAERFATGEIDEQEYATRLAALRRLTGR